MRNLIFLTLTGSVLLYGSAAMAERTDFEANALFSNLGEQVQLPKVDEEKIRGVVDAKSKQLLDVIDQTVDKGFLELGRIQRELDTVLTDAQTQLQAFLDSGQIERLKSFLDSIDREAMETMKDEIVNRMSQALELTEAQLEKTLPVLKEDLQRRSEALGRFIGQGGGALETFQAENERLLNETREKLNGLITTEQLQEFDRLQQELGEKIRGAFNTGG